MNEYTWIWRMIEQEKLQRAKDAENAYCTKFGNGF
jgi:hypothetical protein